jgi:hypothetical protein
MLGMSGDGCEQDEQTGKPTADGRPKQDAIHFGHGDGHLAER